MVKPFPYIALFGDSFSPAKTEQETGLRFSEKHEVGQLGKHGRYKGKPFPFGHAILEAPEHIEPNVKIEWLLDVALPYKDVLRQLGVTNGKVHVTYAYDHNFVQKVRVSNQLVQNQAVSNRQNSTFPNKYANLWHFHGSLATQLV